MGENQNNYCSSFDANHQKEEEFNTNMHISTTTPPPVAFVEPEHNYCNDNNMDMDIQTADECTIPLTVIEGGDQMMLAQQQQYYSSSSLSCDEDSDEEQLVNLQAEIVPPSRQQQQQQLCDERQQQQQQHQHQILQRRDSRGSSTSSRFGAASGGGSSNRDWGWFDEEVHFDSNHINNARNSNSNTSRGLTAAQHHENKNNNGMSGGDNNNDSSKSSSMNNNQNGASAMAVTAPNYVLEESLSSQKLWKESAGQRPPQPVEERAFFEKMWTQNFARSEVDYKMPVDALTAASPMSLNPFADGNFDGGDSDHAYDVSSGVPQNTNATGGNVAEAALVHRMNQEPYGSAHVEQTEVKDSAGEGKLTVLVRGDNVFGTTVSKSFARVSEQGEPIAGVDTINISVASYRVVESKKHGKYAQFLVIYREGSIRDTVGIWKRYSDFEELAHKVTQAHEGCAFANISPLAVAEESETEHLPNAITSWRLLKKRKRWYRCLDAGYLSLKVFLLERFLHDILFESSSPHLLRDFVGVDADLFY